MWRERLGILVMFSGGWLGATLLRIGGGGSSHFLISCLGVLGRTQQKATEGGTACQNNNTPNSGGLDLKLLSQVYWPDSLPTMLQPTPK